MSYLNLAYPTFLMLAVAGLWRVWRRQGENKPWMLATGLLGAFLISWTPAAWLLSQPLEAWYPRTPPAASDAQAIVVLSGGVLPSGPDRPAAVANRDTAERTIYAAWLHRNWKAVPVLACGGPMERDNPPLAELMKQLLLAADVPREMIWTESESRNTFENAAKAAAILRDKGIRDIALVTEAYHMPRAERAFRKQGLHVTPAPCCFQSLRLRPSEILPGPNAIRKNEAVLHEAVGLAWYWTLGRL